ncbi:hypothetical protein BO70DRAFT_384724 [Aspergillus heteromorphus CBS 117.55]|uniref:Zn(2)-C6 fungal-type domain-containing protein n=1 Tax=Aspergillus heteromorphus CBS 117.55 TaxID=1448321 RepID=A0A317X0T7_9EURO|nr:uncharacterized protein BO70DRAFT_384724 [Aspergillus heteromorphus CBS 117.55]PWY91212.1 hypothetical protein BO70DRAFT_384724 [Aspergillus heteromorphus CBS 117.55]
MQNSELAAGTWPSWTVQDHPPVIQQSAGPKGPHDLGIRRRNPLACEACYKKKTKCEVEGSSRTCVQCLRRNTACKFTTRKEKREDLKRSHYIRTLEDRVRKTESLLRVAGLLNEDLIGPDHDPSDEDEGTDSGADSEDEIISPYFSPRDFSSRRSSAALISDGTRDSDRAQYRASTGEDPDTTSDAASASARHPPGHNASSKTAECGHSEECSHTHAPVFKWDSREDSRYYGRSSSLSILSREALEWIKNKTGEVKILNVVFADSNRDNPWDAWRPEVFHDLFASEVFKPLPPRAEVFTLLRDYFRTVNRLFPLYHEATFMKLVEWQYTQQTCDDAARWASINIILSLAYEYRFSNCQKSEKDRERAWLYYKNAMSVFAELSLRRTDLLSVQALLGMALFLRGNSGTQSALPIITAAIQTCHRMGLHRDLPRPYLSQVEQEQRKRVFWIAYIMDQSTCVRAGSAPAQHYEDFDVDFPADNAEDAFVKPHDNSFFRQLCKITVVKSRVFSKLYAARALENKSPAEIFDTIDELHAELEEWKSSNSFDTQLRPRGSGEDFLIGFASAGLQFVYYNTKIMIHRLPVMIQFASTHFIAQGDAPSMDYDLISAQASASAAICVQAARDTVKLVNNLPWGDIAWIWSLLYYIFLAVMNIFVNILRDPLNKKAKDDLQSLNMAATFFATLIPGDGPCHYARFMTKMCANFERVARAVLDRTQRVIKPGETKYPPRKPTTFVPNSQFHHHPRPQSSPSVSPSTTSIDIPNLEGLPPVNSSGYVVPDDLSPSPPPPAPVPAPEPSHPLSATNIPINPPVPAPQTAPASIPAPAPALAPSRAPAPTPASQPYSNPTTANPNPNPYLTNAFFPISVNSDNFNFQQPELWQIPLTADWEITPQVLTGLFGPDSTYLFPEDEMDTTGSQPQHQPHHHPMSMSMASAPPPPPPSMQMNGFTYTPNPPPMASAQPHSRHGGGNNGSGMMAQNHTQTQNQNNIPTTPGGHQHQPMLPNNGVGVGVGMGGMWVDGTYYTFSS